MGGGWRRVQVSVGPTLYLPHPTPWHCLQTMNKFSISAHQIWSKENTTFWQITCGLYKIPQCTLADLVALLRTPFKLTLKIGTQWWQKSLYTMICSPGWDSSFELESNCESSEPTSVVWSLRICFWCHLGHCTSVPPGAAFLPQASHWNGVSPV